MAKVLVCRCEDVTLHELEDAVARGHADIESLKRYTGFVRGRDLFPLFDRLLAERGGDASLPFTPRPPFHPLPLADLAGLAEVAEEDAGAGRPPH